MPTEITDVDEFSAPAQGPAAGEGAAAAAMTGYLQVLANRTRYLFNRLGGVPSLAVNTVLGRASTGATEGKATTDQSFAFLALSSIRAWFDALHAAGADVAAGATTNLATATGHLVRITGTGTTITSFGSAAAGVRRTVYFASDGVVVAHGVGSIEFPAEQNFESLAGDALDLVSLGSSTWKVLAIHRVDGVPPQVIPVVDNSEYAGDQMIVELSDISSNQLLTDADVILFTGALTFGESNFADLVGADLKYARVRRKTFVNANAVGSNNSVILKLEASEPLAEYRFARADQGNSSYELNPGDSVDVVWDPDANRIRVVAIVSTNGGPS